MPCLVRFLRSFLSRIAPALVVASAAAQTPSHTPSARLILRHATLLDGVDSVPRNNVMIAIRAGRIERIRRDDTRASQTVAPGDSVIDLHGAWVVPGLIDAHVHVGLRSTGSAADHRAAALRALQGGATTVRFMGTSAWADVALRNEFERGEVPLPRVLAAGQAITPVVNDAWLRDLPSVRPFVTPATEADSALRITSGPGWRLKGAAAMDATVGALKTGGADWIKVFATGRAGVAGSGPLTTFLDEDDLRSVVRAAHRRGLMVGAHAHGDAGIRAAVRAGVRTIEHGTFASDETLRLMRARGTCFVPTLSFWDELATNPDSVLRTRAVSMRATAMNAVRRARVLGVTVIAGSDNIYASDRRNLGLELAALSEAGLSPSEVLIAATSRSARCLGLSTRLGAIAPHHEADVLILDQDPRADVRHLANARVVIVGGRVVIDRGGNSSEAARPK